MRIGYQVIVENQDYEIKYRIYDIIQRAKEQRAKEAEEAMQAQQEEVSAEVTAG
jgi:acyl-homoserine lactone acylase PvdQ